MPGRTKGSIYTPDMMRKLEGIPLPAKIKCARCEKSKALKNFSKKQLADARNTIKEKGQGASFSINCDKCAGGKQLVEIECTMCNKTKGIHAFAKSQRNKPDEAECFACVEDRLAQDAIDEEVYAGADRDKAFVPEYKAWPSAFDSDRSVDESTTDNNRDWEQSKGGISLSSGFAEKLTLKDNDQDSLIESEYETGSQTHTSDSGEWQTVPTKSWHSNSNKTSSTKFNPNAYRKPSTGSSTASVSGSSRTWSSGYAEPSGRSTTSKSGWAKIRAYDPKRDGENPYTAQAFQEDLWSDDEDEDEKPQADDLGDEDDSD